MNPDAAAKIWAQMFECPGHKHQKGKITHITCWARSKAAAHMSSEPLDPACVGCVKGEEIRAKIDSGELKLPGKRPGKFEKKEPFSWRPKTVEDPSPPEEKEKKEEPVSTPQEKTPEASKRRGGRPGFGAMPPKEKAEKLSKFQKRRCSKRDHLQTPCCLCREIISKGDEYYYGAFGISYYAHAVCVEDLIPPACEPKPEIVKAELEPKPEETRRETLSPLEVVKIKPEEKLKTMRCREPDCARSGEDIPIEEMSRNAANGRPMTICKDCFKSKRTKGLKKYHEDLKASVRPPLEVLFEKHPSLLEKLTRIGELHFRGPEGQLLAMIQEAKEP